MARWEYGVDALTNRMGRLPDEDLVRIAFPEKCDGFEETFIQAAKSELERRGISSDQTEVLKYEAAEVRELDDVRSSEPLGLPGKILFLVFGPFFLAWFATYAFKHLGYDQKFRDAWRWIFYGFGFCAAIAIIFVFMDATSS